MAKFDYAKSTHLIVGAFCMVKSHKNRGDFLELSRDEVFNKLTENGKYTGVCENEYKGMHLGVGCYISSGTIKMKYPRTEKTFYDSWREIRCEKLDRFGI